MCILLVCFLFFKALSHYIYCYELICALIVGDTWLLQDAFGNYLSLLPVRFWGGRIKKKGSQPKFYANCFCTCCILRCLVCIFVSCIVCIVVSCLVCIVVSCLVCIVVSCPVYCTCLCVLLLSCVYCCSCLVCIVVSCLVYCCSCLCVLLLSCVYCCSCLCVYC